MLVGVGVVPDVSVVRGRMGQFPCDVLHPLPDRLPGDFRGQTMVGFLLFDQVGEFVNSHVVALRGNIEPGQERRFGENHHPAEMLQADHAQAIFIGGSPAV